MDPDAGQDADRLTGLLGDRGVKLARQAGAPAVDRTEDTEPGRRADHRGQGSGAHSRTPDRTRARNRNRTAPPAGPRGREGRPSPGRAGRLSPGKAEAVPALGSRGEIGPHNDPGGSDPVLIGMQLGRLKVARLRQALEGPATTEAPAAPVLANGNLGRAPGAPRIVAPTARERRERAIGLGPSGLARIGPTASDRRADVQPLASTTGRAPAPGHALHFGRGHALRFGQSSTPTSAHAPTSGHVSMTGHAPAPGHALHFDRGRIRTIVPRAPDSVLARPSGRASPVRFKRTPSASTRSSAQMWTKPNSTCAPGSHPSRRPRHRHPRTRFLIPRPTRTRTRRLTSQSIQAAPPRFGGRNDRVGTTAVPSGPDRRPLGRVVRSGLQRAQKRIGPERPAARLRPIWSARKRS